MLWIWTTLLAGAKTVAAQQTIQSISGEFQWICPDSRTPETVLANSCQQQSTSGAASLLGVQAFTNYPDTTPSNPFTTAPNGYQLECSYGTGSEVSFTCVYTGEERNLEAGSNADCPRLNAQQPSARAFKEDSYHLAKRLVIPDAPVCPDTGDSLAFYRSEALIELGTRDPTQSGYFVTCSYYPGQICGFDADGNLLRDGGNPGNCPVNLCDPVAPTRRKRGESIASRQQRARRIRRSAYLPSWAVE